MKITNLNIKREKVYPIILTLLGITQSFTINICSYLVVILFIFFLIDKNIKTKLQTAFKNKIVLLFLGFVVLHIIGFVVQPNIDKGIAFLQKIILIFILPIIVFSEPISEKSKDIFCKFFIALLIIASVYIIYVETFFYFLYINETYLLHPMDNSNNYLIGILIVLYLFQSKKIKLTPAILLITLFIIVIMVLGSRINFLSIVTCISIYAIAYFRKNKKLLITTFSSMMIGFSILVLTKGPLYHKLEDMITSGASPKELIKDGKVINEKVYGNSNRILLWYIASKMIEDKPIFGWGPGNDNQEYNKRIKDYDFHHGMKKWRSTHNQFLQEGMKLGFIGITYFVFMLIVIFINIFKQKKLLCLFLLLNFLFNCISESPFERHVSTVFFSLFLPFTYILTKNNERENS